MNKEQIKTILSCRPANKFEKVSYEYLEELSINQATEIIVLQQQNKELHNKIDKTIKYLETNGYGDDCCGDMCYFLDEDNQKDLLEILKGDVDE